MWPLCSSTAFKETPGGLTRILWALRDSNLETLRPAGSWRADSVSAPTPDAGPIPQFMLNVGGLPANDLWKLLASPQ